MQKVKKYTLEDLNVEENGNSQNGKKTKKLKTYQNFWNKLRLRSEKSIITNQCFKKLKIDKLYTVQDQV